ncbi:hypothetical protein Hte_011450 [Hypoxylon texense]
MKSAKNESAENESAEKNKSANVSDPKTGPANDKADAVKSSKVDIKPWWTGVADPTTGRSKGFPAKDAPGVHSVKTDRLNKSGALPRIIDSSRESPNELGRARIQEWVEAIPAKVFKSAEPKAHRSKKRDPQEYAKRERETREIEKKTLKERPVATMSGPKQAFPGVSNAPAPPPENHGQSQSQSQSVLPSYNIAAEFARLNAGTAERRKNEPPKVNKRAPRVQCHLRPAHPADMAQIAAIYNNEVTAGAKLLDRRPIQPHEFRSLHREGRAANLPFVVAVRGLLWERPGNGQGTVIGFAFVDHGARGITGSHETLGVCNGKITAVVEPQFRRKNVCTALLDAVFTICSPTHVHIGGYESVALFRKSFDEAHLPAKEHPRAFLHLELEYVLPGAASLEAVLNSKEYKWIDGFLHSSFRMSVVHHDELYYHDPRFQPRWFNRLVFRHRCRGDAMIEMKAALKRAKRNASLSRWPLI